MHVCYFSVQTPNTSTHFTEVRGRVKLLCGADLLESFATPDLWESCDVSVCECVCVCV